MLVTRYFPTLGETGQGQQPGALRRGCQAGRKSPSPHLLVLCPADTQLQAWLSLWSSPHFSPGILLPEPLAALSEAEERSHPRDKAQQESRQSWRKGRPSPGATPENRKDSLPLRWGGAGSRLSVCRSQACSLHILFESSPLQKGQGCIYRNVWGSLLSHLHFSLSLLSSPQFPTKMKSCSR